VAWSAYAFLFVSIVVTWALVFTLFAAFVAVAFGAHLFVEAVVGTLFTPWMTFATDLLASKRLIRTVFVWRYPIHVVAI
jgi:hypothetical protein